jgi:GNAT superfamily N-acetyltransferase
LTVSIEPEPFDSAEAQALVSALAHDLDVRYGDEDEAYLLEVEPAEMSPPLGVFLVARIDGKAVGCGGLRPLPGRDGSGEIKRMYVSREARGAGVGRALLAEFEARGPTFGFRVLRLETGDAQPEAVSLYETAGWSRIASYGRYADAPSSICFAKELPSELGDETR